jgi:hypothetical protein
MSFDDYRPYSFEVRRVQKKKRPVETITKKTEPSSDFNEVNKSSAPDAAHNEILSILNHFQSIGFKHAIAAGGALRDLDHGRTLSEVKDIDIIVNMHDLIYNRPDLNIPLSDLREKITELISNKFLATTKNKAAYGFAEPRINKNWNYARPYSGSVGFKWNDLNIDVCLVDWPVTVQNWFDIADFGLSRIAMTEDGRIHKSEEYNFDKAHKAFVIRGCANTEDLKNSLSRYALISKRYPDYGLGLPVNLGDWYKRAVDQLSSKLEFENYTEKTQTDPSYGLVRINVWDSEKSPLLGKLKRSKHYSNDTIAIFSPKNGQTSFVNPENNQIILTKSDKKLLRQLGNLLKR